MYCTINTKYNMKETKDHIADIIKTFGLDIHAGVVAGYCYSHYHKITGRPISDRNLEMDFPQEIVKIFEWFELRYNFTREEFESWWGE